MSIGRYYAHTDSGAPVLTGQQGSLKDLLKKILVGTAGIAYGTGGSQKSSLGWTVEFESTDKAVFKGELTSTQMLLRIDDSGSGAGSYREAFVVGCESATSVDALTDRFPTTAQFSSGIVWRKSQNVNSTAVPWWMWGDGKTFYLMVNYYGSQYAALFAFGDFVSAKAGDGYNCMVVGGSAVNNSGTIPQTFAASALNVAVTSYTNTAAYAARSHDQITKSVALGYTFPWAANILPPGASNFGPAYPASIVSGLLLAPIFVHEVSMPRGRCRGAHAPLHASGLTAGASIVGVSGFPGATLIPVGTFGNGGGAFLCAEVGTEFV